MHGMPLPLLLVLVVNLFILEKRAAGVVTQPTIGVGDLSNYIHIPSRS